MAFTPAQSLIIAGIGLVAALLSYAFILRPAGIGVRRLTSGVRKTRGGGQKMLLMGIFGFAVLLFAPLWVAGLFLVTLVVIGFGRR